MTTEDLIDYILAQTRKNIPKSLIVSRLENAGWHVDDIEEAFRKVAIPSQPKKEEPVQPKEEIQAKIEPGPEAKPQESEDKIIVPAKPIFATSFSDAHRDMPAKSYYIPDNYPLKPTSQAPRATENKPTQPPATKVEIPMTPNVTPPSAPLISTIPATPIVSPISPVLPKESIVEERYEELMPKLVEKPVIPVVPVSTIPVYTSISTPAPTLTRESNPIPVSTPIPTQTPAPAPIIPPLTPKKIEVVAAPVLAPAPAPISVQPTPYISNLPAMSIPQSAPVGTVPTSAMLYSYPQDISEASKLNQVLSKKKKKTFIKWLIIILVISFLGVIAFAFAGNNIHFPSFGSIVKKDPKTILVNAPIEFSNLKSYKIQTNATLSLPSFADISSGLVTGDTVKSNDTDFLSLSAKGLIDNTTAPTILFDYDTKLSSSFFKKDISTDLKYNNGIAFFTTPDLSQILGKDAPPIGIVLINDGQFDPLFQLLPQSLQNMIEKVDMHKLLSVAVPSYINNETSSIFKDFVSTASVVEKAPEVINGVDTYHYELSADSISTKTFLTRFANVFLGDMPDSDRQNLNAVLGSVSIDSLEVWIGKKDSMIYQYKFKASAPLSKLIGLEDQGIAGKMVSLDWKTTYSDFDVINNIILPTNVISVSSFMNIVNDAKVKNILTSFNTLVHNFHNATGSYGKRPNPTGSCTNPNPSSIFSPVGHPNGAMQAVGAIASAMNSILNLTNGSLACYSTADAWALEVPLLSKPDQYFCVDSTGANSVLGTPIKGAQCK